MPPPCRFGARCTRRDTCPFSHDIQPCRFGTRCARRDSCPFSHNAEPEPCKFGGRCARRDSCPFSHDPVPCRFGARCTRRDSCPFSHDDGGPALQPEGPIFSIDVECVATDTTHNGRSVAQIALVDAEGRCVLNLYVTPPVPVVSHLEGLTGITAELLSERGRTMEVSENSQPPPIRTRTDSFPPLRLP